MDGAVHFYDLCSTASALAMPGRGAAPAGVPRKCCSSLISLSARLARIFLLKTLVTFLMATPSALWLLVAALGPSSRSAWRPHPLPPLLLLALPHDAVRALAELLGDGVSLVDDKLLVEDAEHLPAVQSCHGGWRLWASVVAGTEVGPALRGSGRWSPPGACFKLRWSWDGRRDWSLLFWRDAARDEADAGVAGGAGDAGWRCCLRPAHIPVV